MAIFNSPTSFFVGNLNEKDKRFEKVFFKGAKEKGFSKFVEPCSGELAMSQIAIEAGFEDIEASDITLFSTLLGYYVTDRPIDELNVEIEGIGKCNDIVETLYWQMLFKLKKNEGQYYFDNYIKDVTEKKEYHKARIKETLDMARERFNGKVTYEAKDMVVHLMEQKENSSALVVMNFPTYKGGYEKNFDVGDKIIWNEPKYSVFDPKEDKYKIKEQLHNSKCLSLFYEEAYPEEAVFEPLYVRFGAREGMNTYITTNDKERAEWILNDKYAVWLSDRKMSPLKYRLAENDFEFKEDSKIEIVPANVENCTYYRKLLTHNFVGSSSDSGFAVIVDKKVIGVFGYSKTFSAFFGDSANDSLFIQFAMAKPVKGYRTARLLTEIAITKEVAWQVMNDLERYSYDNIKTTMISKYPESKQMRGIMKMCKKEFDEKSKMYKLVYSTKMKERTVEEAYKTWLKKEKDYRKSKR